MNLKCLLISTVHLSLFSCVCSFEILSASILGISAVAKFALDNTYCRYKECCTDSEIPADFDKLHRLLEDKIYGQHLAKQVVINALKAHWMSPHVKKALTLSFHGWPGGGKNYVTKFIQDSLFAKGSQSDHVHHFVGRIHFPLAEKSREYQANLYSWISGNVTRCRRQLFIFDEVDKMPSSVLNGIKPIIDYHESIEKVDYRECIFIFLSNTGSTLINEHYMKMWRDGVKRDQIKLKDFEKLIAQGAFNEEGWLHRNGILNNIIRNIVLYFDMGVWYQRFLDIGGFHHSDTIRSNLIDHYIPFLPMEYEHVKLCIIDEFKIRNITWPSSSDIEEVMEYVEWGPAPENLLSKTGCKRLSQKVGFVVQKNYN